MAFCLMLFSQNTNRLKLHYKTDRRSGTLRLTNVQDLSAK